MSYSLSDLHEHLIIAAEGVLVSLLEAARLLDTTITVSIFWALIKPDEIDIPRTTWRASSTKNNNKEVTVKLEGRSSRSRRSLIVVVAMVHC